MSEVYFIRDPRQLALLVSVRRGEIVDCLAGTGPATIREVAAALGMRASALYHHFQLLEEAGLVVDAGTRLEHGKPARVFRTPGVQMRWGIGLLDPDHAATWHKLNAAQCRQSERDFQRGLESAEAVPEGPGKNLRTFRIVGRPDPETLAAINHHLDQVVALLYDSASGDGTPIAVSCVGAPLQ